MKTNTLPLKQLSIDQIYNGERAIYEVPIYQRNYAWEKDEIAALIQDVFDAYTDKKDAYFVGTLVSFNKGEQVYEVIDGQQRLTTINLVLNALNINLQNKLTYRARKKSNDTIQSIPDFEIDETDTGIVQGFEYVKESISDKIDKSELDGFKNYFLHKVFLIHYQVPKDIDLNHYFEIMNSRGEQLEKHEIIKASLIKELRKEDKAKFNLLWEYCSEMNVYIQQKYRCELIFGKSLSEFNISNFGELPPVNDNLSSKKIKDLINSNEAEKLQAKHDKIDSFQPIMDFPNFLLVVLKFTLIKKPEFSPIDFTLDDKELLNEFKEIEINETFVKEYGFNLLKAKYFLDNYIVHHSNEEDSMVSNPWKLQQWHKDGKNEKLKTLDGTSVYQNKLVQLLSMFEVSFTARQRKNYLFYVIMYLFNNEKKDIESYYEFVSKLAEKYFRDVYLDPKKLNQINTPNPGSFDETMLINNELNVESLNNDLNFSAIYGDGTSRSKGIPLFIFNYLDFKLWNDYIDTLKGEEKKETDTIRINFFNKLGCRDFGLNVFRQFYFSRTRRSLEHFFATANIEKTNGALNVNQINCLGNYAMIGSEANSSGSNWSPKSKLNHYLDLSGKIKQVSVASIKFMVMMQKCKDNIPKRESDLEWNFEDIKTHQQKMLEFIISKNQPINIILGPMLS